MVEALLGRMVGLGGEASFSARSLASVWGFGATCLSATVLLPHPARANDAGLVAVVAIAYPVAAAMFFWPASFRRGALEAITYLGQLLITLLTVFWGAPDAPFLWFHVWLVVHTFHFLPASRATRQVLCAAILFVVGTVLIDTPFPAATSVVGVGSIVIIGVMVGAFRARVDVLVQALAHSAATDPLTGLANRRAFGEAFVDERARRARTDSLGALLVLDVDCLKDLNDRDGHAAGDLALLRVTEALAASIREVDTPARLGGDEFAVLLSALDPDGAVAVAERIRRAVAEGARPDEMTLSIGIVELPSVSLVELNVALAAADRALYRAKRRGGNCVAVGTLAETAIDGPGVLLPDLVAAPRVDHPDGRHEL